MTTSQIELEIDATGRGRLVIDGNDVSGQVYGIQLIARVGEVTEALVHFRPVQVTGEAIALVTEETAIHRFLDSVDVEALNDAALEFANLDESPAAAIIRVLRERADAQTVVKVGHDVRPEH